MLTPQQQILNKCQELIVRAKQLYNVDLSVVNINFNLKGCSAGYASWKRTKNGISYECRFNDDMISRGDISALEDMRDETCAHEFGHLICFMRPELGRKHDAGWRHVCQTLGGTGDRSHDTEVVYGHGQTYEYVSTFGNKIRVGEKYHAKIQSGETIQYRKNLGSLNRNCPYWIVGISGRTLKDPILPCISQRKTTIAPVASTVFVKPVTPTVQTIKPLVVAHVTQGESKAAISRKIMLSGYQAGKSYETIIAEMQAANGYNRQLARGTFKANAPKVGIPSTFC